MRSMTGYGRRFVERDGRQLTLELKAVNHRYLDIAFRMPRTLSFLEESMRKRIGERVARGHLDVYATYKNLREDSKSVVVDPALMLAYTRALDDIRDKTGIRDDRTLMSLARLPDILVISEAEEDREALAALVLSALDGALDELDAMRAAEGESLGRDLTARIDKLSEITQGIEARYPDTIIEYTDRLKARVQELLGSATFDEARLMQEVAVMADRSAIAEETVRLRSHFEQFLSTLSIDEPAGRKLDFIVQELNREINTISSKSQDVPITRLALDAKAEIEKIREQIQNME